MRRNVRRAFGTKDRLRLCVFRSTKATYAQIIDDRSGTTRAASSSRETMAKGNKREQAYNAGLLLSERARKAGITTVVFDRRGYKYHGRIAALADGARKGGLLF